MPSVNYRLKDGSPVKGATTIIKQNIGWGGTPLQFWSNKVGREGKTLQEAWDTATIPGTIAHYLIECHLKEQEPDLSQYDPEDIKKGEQAFNNFLQWQKNWDMIPLHVEPNLVSERYKYGGTPDLLALIRGKVALPDWKTGKTYEILFCQLAAYAQLVVENDLCGEVKEFHCLRIPKNEDIPSFHHSYWERLPKEAWESFECALKLSRNEKKLKELL